MRDMSYESYYDPLADAPLEGERVANQAVIPGLRPELKQYTKYLLDRGLDFRNFEVVDVVPQNKTKLLAVIVAHDRCPNAVNPWCIYYGYGGRYFPTLTEAFTYCRGRRFQGSW